MTMAHGSSNFLFILLCGLWYSTSALSSNTGKAILNQFRYPIYKDANANQSNSTEYFSYGFVPSWRSFFFKYRHFQNTRQHGAYLFFFFQIRDQILILSYLLGTISFIYCCGLCTPLRSELFQQNLHLTPSPNHWRHVGMLVRRFCL